MNKRMDECDERLHDPRRLAALKRTKLMDTQSEQAFDRLAHLAAQILKAPLTIISFVSNDRQFFKAAYGLPSPMDVVREIPIEGSICRYTLAGEAIIAADASKDPILAHHPATKPWGIGAFIAIPMVTHDGFVLGAFCAVDHNVRPWTDNDIHLMRELTASVMTEIHLREQVAELKIERDLRDQFVATLTHDLRTPLSVAKMSAELLVDREQSEIERARLAQMISRNMDRADHMIRDLLDNSRIKAGESVALNIQDCELNQISKTSLEELQSIYGDRFVLKSPGEIHGRWDCLAVQRMIENLASNAVKYGSLSKPITLTLSETANAIQIDVHNSGDPIPEANLQSIFEPYRRSESAEQGLQKGWGIGLTLVRGFAEALGGRVQVSSSVKKGTNFTLQLPKLVP